jgi:hypothetical protein
MSEHFWFSLHRREIAKHVYLAEARVKMSKSENSM